jgi:dienelactone hydrolase
VKKLLRRLLLLIPLMTGLLLGAGHLNRVPPLPVPPGVIRRTEQIMLQGERVPVDLFLPASAAKAPVVIVAHGFTRHRRVMSGWGVRIAENGMIAVVPSLPSFANHARNARAIVELAEHLQRPGSLKPGPQPTGRTGLVGHSAGGFATLLATAASDKVHCWIGLDPVDFMDMGLGVVKSLQTPALMLLAEPGSWNRSGNAQQWIGRGAADLLALRIKGSTHCDPENPTSRMAELACGQTDPARRATYERYALAMLRARLLQDTAADVILSQADKDDCVRVLGRDRRAKVE